MAQIVTITNPLTGQPAQVDQLDHTAQQIDDAIARALPGGAIDTDLQNKAPAGFGLGESHGQALSNVSLNSLINNGWYFLYRNNTDGPDNVNISDAILFVSSARSDLTKVQRLTLGTQGMQGYELRRVYNNSSWLPWEWVNPPMKVGVEYRTTERYLGKPVYVQTKEISALAIGSSSSPARTDINNFTDACDKIVRYEMYVAPASGGAKFHIPFIGDTTGVLKASGSLNEGQYLYGSIYSFDDLSKYKANVTCWYTKTTD